jgi:ABC-2 type transport system ATP-binding protein
MAMGATDNIAVEIKGLVKNYGKLKVLKGINLAVEKGKIFGLLGANGAGKSTMIKSIIGITNFNDGEVRVLGMHPIKDSGKVRRHLGYMPQNPALYEELSARDNISFFGAAHQLPDLKKRVDEILEFTELASRHKDPIFTFSGGMKQRVSLACAMVHQPTILFLDEPTAGIDPVLREAFWKHFRELAGEGKTIFCSTHLMDEALLCDQLAILRDGVILAVDTPKNIMKLGHSRLHIWRGDFHETTEVGDYRTALPPLLQKYQLDPSITRIELEEDTLETIVLDLINNRLEHKSQKEATHV